MKQSEASRRYYLAHKEEIRERARKNSARWRAEDPERAKRSRHAFTARQRGLTLEEYDEIFRLHDGKCAICHQAKPKMCLDHDHQTGKARGILCDNCNLAIGNLQDSVEVIQSALEYLKKYKDGRQ